MIVGFTATYAISGYHHQSCEFEFCSWWGVLDTTLCDKVYQWLAAGQRFSLGTLVSSANKTDIIEIVFVASGVKHNKPSHLSVKCYTIFSVIDCMAVGFIYPYAIIFEKSIEQTIPKKIVNKLGKGSKTRNTPYHLTEKHYRRSNERKGYGLSI